MQKSDSIREQGIPSADQQTPERCWRTPTPPRRKDPAREHEKVRPVPKNPWVKE